MSSTNTNNSTYKASNIYNTDQKSHAQFKHTSNSRSKSLITNVRAIHAESIENFGRLKTANELAIKRQPFLELSTNQYQYNFQNNSYANAHNKENFPTSLRKPAIRKSPAKPENKKIEEGLNSKFQTRFLSGTTKSIRFYAQHFKQNQIIKPDVKNKKCFNFNQMLFEIIAQLDSAISQNERTSSREFTIRDNYERMRCIFYEIDRPMEKLTRGSWIRCVGKYNSKTSLFECLSVRLANQTELFSFGQYVNQTNQSLKQFFN